MANYTSAEYQYFEPKSNVNIPLTNAVLAAKQGQYNQIQSQFQNVIDSYGNLDILRDEDKQYLSTKLQDAVTRINAYGNRNLTDPNVQRDIQASMSAVANDPLILNAVENTRKFRTFQSQVQQTREKNPELYSDVNYTDALEQGGVNQYLAGLTNSIGNLQYSNYVNLNEKLNKEAKQYADLLGKEQLLDSTTNQYYVQDTYGQRINVDDIYSHLNNFLDESDRNQLKINARQSLGKASPAQLDAQYSPYLKGKITNIKESKAALEAQLISTTDPKISVALKDRISGLDQESKNYQSQIDTKNYDIYNLYSQGLLQNISSDYAIDRITNVKHDDMPFQIMKFETERSDKELERQAKLQKEQSANLSLPTVVETPRTGEEELPANETILRRNLTQSDQALDAYLRASNENNYNQKTPQEQWSYKVGLKSDDPTAESYSVERQNLIRNFTTVQRGYAKIVNDNTQSLTATVGEAYNAITGANINNLRTELPISAYYLQQGKKFEDLDKNVQKAITLEFGNNWALRGNSNDRDSKALQSSLNSLQSQLESHPSDKVKNLAQSTKNTRQNTAAPTTGGAVAGSYRAPITGLFGTLPAIIGGFNEDTDLTELEEYTGDSSTNVADIMRAGVQTMSTNLNSRSEQINKNLVSNKSLAFSTQSDAQKADATELQSVLIANYPDAVPPNANNNYIVTKVPSGYNITYTTGSGQKTKNETRFVSDLSEGLKSRLNSAETNWNTSYLNPNLVLPQYTFTTKNRQEAYNKIATLAEKRPDIIPYESYAAIYNRGTLKGTEFQSDEDFFEEASENTKFTQSMAEPISNVLRATYIPSFKTVNGKLSGNIRIIYPDGTTDVRLMLSKTNQLDEGVLYTEVLSEIGKYKKQQIDRILGANK